MADILKPEQLGQVDLNPGGQHWMDVPLDLSPGRFCHPAKVKNLEYLGLANPREWSPADPDWKLPENWQEIIFEGLKDRLDKYRSLKIFMDVCVRCGACADKCHFFIGSGDPKNMPVLRAELLRSVYRNDFTRAGKLLGRIAGARQLSVEVVKEWFFYFYQCSECRRCAVFCPFGIDTAEITMMARELLNLLGLNINWILEPAANCLRTGNHLGIQPHAFKEMIDFLANDIHEITGVKICPSLNRKGAEILFVAPSGDVYSDPGTYTFMGYLMLFEHIGLDYTLSTYASEGGNFGLFTSAEMTKRINGKMYEEARRLGVKWILAGECGHMWRVIHQYMNTMNGPADFLEAPVSPVTGTRFDNASSAKVVHIAEFTADLMRNRKLKLAPHRNDHLKVTFHDSCNPARGMGFFEEPRYVISNVCRHFYEMPANTIREQTFCCGSGGGLNADEIMELRLRGGFPRANAVRHVHDKHGVNMLSCICSIDRAVFPALMDYWVPGVDVTGIHELVGNALVMDGEIERKMNLRMEPLGQTEG
ncbi:MAG: (Fe-S)-binding protein [Desulfobacterales bacterium]|nr:(Fe-S)-binding protein [Desulfobacterales bacterium]